MERLGRFLGAFLSIMLFMGIYSIAEEITLTTYYPAPYGAYEELSTTGNTYLATTSGKAVGIGTTAPATGMALDVNGKINATAYSVGTTPGAVNTTITYVKTVDFITLSVTTGSITVVNGIVTVIN
jgi:hypothetical protein